LTTTKSSVTELDKAPHKKPKNRVKNLLFAAWDALIDMDCTIPATVTTGGILGKAQM
jgi:hypothetical protein